MRLLVFALALISGCGGQSPSSEPEAPAPAPAAAQGQTPAPAAASDDEPPPADCDNACTEIAVCWESVNEGSDYHQGGECTSDCGSKSPEEQTKFFDCVVKTRSECEKMLECG